MNPLLLCRLTLSPPDMSTSFSPVLYPPLLFNAFSFPFPAKELIHATVRIWSSESVSVPTRMRAYLLLQTAVMNFPDHYVDMVRMQTENRLN